MNFLKPAGRRLAPYPASSNGPARRHASSSRKRASQRAFRSVDWTSTLGRMNRVSVIGWPDNPRYSAALAVTPAGSLARAS